MNDLYTVIHQQLLGLYEWIDDLEARWDLAESEEEQRCIQQKIRELDQIRYELTFDETLNKMWHAGLYHQKLWRDENPTVTVQIIGSTLFFV